jgi:putative DNA primase/helicase
MNGTQTQFNLLDYRAEDGGILDAWLDLYGESWLYVTGYEAWYRWTGTHWSKDECLSIFAQVQTLMDAMNKAAKNLLSKAYADMGDPNLNKEEKEDIKDEAEQLKAYVNATKRTRARVASVEGMAQAKRATAACRLDAGNVLNLRNGTLDLDAITLRPHCKDDHMTYCLDYDYDPDATCPRYEQFLSEVLVKEEQDENGQWVTDFELCQLYQELKGYSLTNDTKFEVMTWLAGEGGNGKSVEIATTQKLLGPLCASIDFQTIGMPGNYDLSDIPGRRVIFSTESERGGKVAEGYLKRIVSGERIKARPIYGSQFEFNSVSKVWWAMNDKPIIKDTGNSIWRRLKLIPFNRTFTEQDKDPELGQKLEAEQSGILNFALDGLRRLRQRGKLPEAAAVTKAIAEYRQETNAVSQWRDERTVSLNAPVTLSSELHTDYREWCGKNGREAFNNTNFGKELKRLGVAFKPNSRSTTGKVGNCYALGLKL